MGTGWSQDDEASQSQPSICGEPKDPRRGNQANYITSSNNIGNDVVKAKAVQDGESEAKPRGNGKKSMNDQLEEMAKDLHNLDVIIAYSDSPLDRRNGIFLNQKRQKYWVDKKGKKCFMVYARDLSIVWGEDNRYWIWYPAKDASDDESIEVAELLDVCWLEVGGKFDAKNLSPRTTYQVSIVVMVKQQSYGWDSVNPVNLTLNLPDGSKSERKVNVMSVQPREQWVEIPAGIFRTSPENQQGEITFSLNEYRGGTWKRGLVIKGVKIQPA